MEELEVLEDMIKSTLDKKFEYTKNEFLNQLRQVCKAIATRDKEIELKDKHIKELEYKVEDILFKANMYKSMIQGIFDKI